LRPAIALLAAVLPGVAIAAVSYRDDFGNGPRLSWGGERGEWVVTGGQYAASQPSNLPPTASLLPWVVGDFELSVDVIDPVDGGLWLRTGNGANRGVLLIVKPSELYWHVISDPSTGPYTRYAEVPVTLPAGTTRLRVVGNGLLLSAYLNDDPTPITTLDLATVTTPPGATYRVGRIGLHDNANPGHRYDNLVLTAAAAPPEDAAGWWPAENNADDAAGTANGAITGTVTYAAGKSGRAFRTTGNGLNYVAIPDGPTTDLPTQFTLEAWLRPGAGLSNPSNAWGLFSKAAPPFPEGLSYQFVLPNAGDDDAAAQSQFRNAAQFWPAQQVTGGRVDVGIWSHLGWTYDGNVSRIYIDGIERAAAVVGLVQPADVPTPLLLNCDGYGNGCSPVEIDEAVVYHRALTAQEIAARHGALAAQEVPLPYRIDMAGGTLDAHWTVLNRLAPTPRFVGSGHLRLTTTPTDLFGPTNNVANLPLVRLPPIGGDFAVTSAFRFDAPPAVFPQQAGVLVLDERSGTPDQDNYLRNSYVVEPQRRFEAVYDVAGVPGPVPNGPLVDIAADTPYWQRIERIGGAYRFSWSPDGEYWQPFFDADAATVIPRYAGLFALHGFEGPPPASFDAISFDVSTTCVTPPTALVSHWRLADTRDESGRNPLTSIGSPDFPPARVGIGTALDGTSQHLAAPAPQGLPVGPAPRTITLWAKTPRNLAVQTDSALIQYGSPSTGNVFGLITSVNAPGSLYFYGSDRDVAGATALQPDTWYHVAVTYDGTTIRLYVDGREDGSGNRVLDTVLDSNGLTIGLRPGCCRWQGVIDDVQVYARALSGDEIAAIHAAGAAGLCRPEQLFANGFEGP
jgi:hypothetical protein